MSEWDLTEVKLREKRIIEVKPEYRLHLRWSILGGVMANKEELRELYEELKEMFEPTERGDA